MKTTHILAFLFLLFIGHAAAKTDFGSAVEIFARSYEAASYGTYEVTSDGGLKKGVYKDVDYVNPVRSTADLVTPFKFSFVLNFRHYKTQVQERAYIYDKNNQPLFHWIGIWSPVETLSSDGKKLTYQIPDYVGAIRFQLADRKIKTDADGITVQLANGSSFGLFVNDGYVTVPGYVYEQEGVFIEWKGDGTTTTDIQTGLPVTGGSNVITTKTEGSGVEGIRTVQLYYDWLYLSPISYHERDTTIEFVSTVNGNVPVFLIDEFGTTVKGVWYTVVGKGKPATYVTYDSSGRILLSAKPGEVIHVKPHWGGVLFGEKG